MCIIFVAKEKRPADDVLVRADDRNDDGIGLAWRAGRQVRWEKALTIKQLLDRLHNDPPPFPYVMHFRSATVGGEDKELCHPFVASPSASTALRGAAGQVLFHNGHWHSWDFKMKEALLGRSKKIPRGPWSDSRAFAWFVGTYGKEVLDWLDLKNEQRICLFTPRDIHVYGKWSQCDGFLNSDPTYPHRDGPINITPKDEFEKKTKLSRKERRRLRKEAESKSTGIVGSSQRLLTQAAAVHCGRRIPSWEEFDQLNNGHPHGKVIDVWPAPSASRSDDDEEELPVIETKRSGVWSQLEVEEVLQELRVFIWETFKLARPKMPRLDA